MCLAIPAKVISIDGPMGIVSIEDVEYKASLMLLDEVRVGDYVMLHAGFAIEKINPEEAAETLRLLNEVAPEEMRFTNYLGVEGTAHNGEKQQG